MMAATHMQPARALVIAAFLNPMRRPMTSTIGVMQFVVQLAQETMADVAPGTFLAAVGADNPAKQEIDPALMASATVVVDVLDQCAEIGELHHALAAGLMTREQVHAELGDVVAGRRPGRTRREEITIFDSSGTALQDVAAAIAVYEKACVAGRGTEVKLDG